MLAHTIIMNDTLHLPTTERTRLHVIFRVRALLVVTSPTNISKLDAEVRSQQKQRLHTAWWTGGAVVVNIGLCWIPAAVHQL